MRRKQDKGFAGILLIGGAALLLAAVVSVGIGSTRIPLPDVVKSIAAACGLLEKEAVDPAVYAVVVSIRLPRVLCGLLAGSGLALSGAVMQGVFRNPLADPRPARRIGGERVRRPAVNDGRDHVPVSSAGSILSGRSGSGGPDPRRVGGGRKAGRTHLHRHAGDERDGGQRAVRRGDIAAPLGFQRIPGHGVHVLEHGRALQPAMGTCTGHGGAGARLRDDNPAGILPAGPAAARG